MAAPPTLPPSLMTPTSPAPDPSPPAVAAVQPDPAPPAEAPPPTDPRRPTQTQQQQKKLTKQQKKERARQRLAERGLLTPEPTFPDRPASSPRTPDVNLPDFLKTFEPGRTVAPDESPAPVQFSVPPAIRTLAQVDLVMGLASLFVAGAMASGVGAAYATSVGGGGFGTFSLTLLGLAFLVAAAGLILLRPFGRQVQLGLCIMSLPFGGLTLPAAVLIAIYLMRPGVALLLSGRTPGQLTSGHRGLIREDTPSLRLIRAAAAIQMIVLVYHVFPLLRAL